MKNELLKKRIMTSNEHMGTIINFNDFREPSMQVGIQMDNVEIYNDIVFVSVELAQEMISRYEIDNENDDIDIHNEIMRELNVYKTILEEKGYIVLYIGLYGSQNYSLQDKDSDIDVKAIILPTLHDIIFRNNVSTTIECEKGNIDVKDLVTFYDVIKKGNFSYIESIETKYYIGYKYIKDLFSQFKPNLKSIVGAMHDKRNALDHPYPSKVEEFAKWGCDPKQYHHIIRLFDLLIYNLNNDEQKSFIDYNDENIKTQYPKDVMINIKRNTLDINKTEMLSDSDDYINRARDLVDYKTYSYDIPDIDEKISTYIENHIKSIICSEKQD